MTAVRTFAALAWRAGLVLLLVFLLAAPRLASAQAPTISTCRAANERGTAPEDFRDYCWLDFTGYSDSLARQGEGQPFQFNLPDGTRITMRVFVEPVSGVGSGQAIVAQVVPSWSGSGFGNSAFKGIPGLPVLYNAQNGTTSRITLRNIAVTPPTGGTASYSMIAADGESSNQGEQLVFVTNGGDWERVAQVPAQTSPLFPTQSPTGTTGLGKTVTIDGVAGTVGAYVYRTPGNPTEIQATVKGSGLQGVIFGVRYASVSVVSQFAGAGRYYPGDQMAYALRTGNGTTLVTGATSGTGLAGHAPAVMPTVAASYPFQVVQSMAPGSLGTLANYSTTLTCVNANPSSTTVMPVNEPVSSYVFPDLKYRDSVFCTFTNTPLHSSVSGSVYHDANANGARDGSEGGTGLSGLHVKLAPVSGGACTGPAQYTAPVAAATGAFTIANVPAGEYCLLLDTNATLSDVTPTLPAGWIGLQNGTGSVRVTVPTGTQPAQPQSFGLFRGSRLEGVVFSDVGGVAAVANDGQQQSGEPGIGGVVVRATAGATVVASAVTAGDGSFTLWLPDGAGPLVLGPAQVPAGLLASGGSAGTTGGTFSRPNLAFTPAAGQSYTGVAIGLVPGIVFSPDGTQTALPGTVAFHAHRFEAGSGGQVSFELAASATPAGLGWTQILYRDSNCNATLEGTEPILSAPLAVGAGEVVCLIVKQFVPAGAAIGAQNVVTVTAQFSYTGASPALSATATVTDLTVVGEPAALVLRKQVANVTQGSTVGTSVNARPGDVLQYTLTAENKGTAPLGTLAIHDTTAAYTTFVSAACPGTLPAGITACSVSHPAVGVAGSLQWSFTGTLAPGGQLSVQYQVRLAD